MVRSCCVRSCKREWNPFSDISFFSFPIKNDQLLQKWLEVVPTNCKITNNVRICNLHFEDQFLEQKFGKRCLRKDAIPSLFEVEKSSAIVNEEHEIDNPDEYNEPYNFLEISCKEEPVEEEENDEECKPFVAVDIIPDCGEGKMCKEEGDEECDPFVAVDISPDCVEGKICKEEENLKSDPLNEPAKEELTVISPLQHVLSERRCGACSEKRSKPKFQLDVEAFHCKKCKKGFTSKETLRIHLKCHSSDATSSVCVKGFSDKNKFKLHKKDRAREKFYQCAECRKEFRLSRHLTVHMLRCHTEERPFECEVCGNDFTLRNDFVRHMKLHIGGKPYKCDICSKGFSRSSSLKVHMRCHSGEKPFQCEICMRSFSQKSNMKVHKCSTEGNVDPI